MNLQLKMMYENQLKTLRDERAASIADYDAKIADIEKQLGIQKADDKKQSAAEQFQAERDAAPSPFKTEK